MMNNPDSNRPPFDCPAKYRICVRGSIAPGYTDWLEGMSIQTRTAANGGELTDLEGLLADQAALAGVLNTLYNLRLAVIMVECLSDCS